MNFRFWPRIAAWLWPVFLMAFLILPASAREKGPKLRDIYDTIAANPILTKFTLMLQASDLGTFLSSRGPFTVFAPTDSAFARLPPGTLEALLEPQNKERLQDIVLFHVVNGKRLTASDLLKLKTEISCQGNPLIFKTSRLGTQYINRAKITHSDIKCQNGLIHQIDTMLMPLESSLPPIAAAPPPPPPAPPATNAPSATGDTNAAPANTNGDNIPVAPMAKPADVSGQ